jgi:hypothetical protein
MVDKEHKYGSPKERVEKPLFVRELDFSASGGIPVTRTRVVREFQFPNHL